MYFCEDYKHGKEIHINSVFTTGSFVVMLKSSKAMRLGDVVLEFEKYDTSERKFVFYKKYDFTVKPKDNFICFAKTQNNDMVINEPGFYLVVVLNQRGEVVANSILEVVEGKK